MTISETFPSIPEVLPEGQLGLATIRHFEVSQQDAAFTLMRQAATGGREQAVRPGKYAQLLVGRTLMMSDTQMERRSNYEVVRRADGEVFIAGLGLGMILHPILAKENVTRVTVVEKYADVIKLVAPTLPHQEKLRIVEADVLDWKPEKGTRYDVVYFDIWPNITTDNQEDMALLHKRFAHYKRPGGWMDSWMRDTLKARKRQKATRRGGWY